jgi:preprotein translocase subunit SecA
MFESLKGAATKMATGLFGTKSERDVKKVSPLVDEINAHFAALQDLPDEAVQAKTVEFRQRLAQGASLDDLLAEAFAVVKEACRRHKGKSWPVVDHATKWEMVPFDVQLMGAVVLHQGKIAEMATGEGKTLVAIIALYLNALEGKGAHLVTVNDYLARRDSEWVGKILNWLGLTVGCIQHDQDTAVRRAAYMADVTYGTNNEFGFDYLRDNMVIRGEDRVQRPHHFAIVDEVDSVLIDEARTPLIISGPVAHSYQNFDKLCAPVENLVRRQNTLISRYLDEAEKLLASSDEKERYQAGIRLLQVSRGAPKHKKFMKMTSEAQDLKRLIHSVENDYMRDKRLHELDEDLLYAIDEKGHTVALSDDGRTLMAPNDPTHFVLPDLSEEIGRLDADPDIPLEEKIRRKDELHQRYAEKSEMLGNVTQLLRAYCLYEKDVEYVVQEGKVLIVDEFTGRLMPGRRFSDGLHQALEAKEKVRVGEENQTLATITIQNYFRLYKKLAGMTGTAETEAGEFFEIYKLDVVVIPTNEPVRRVDYEDLVYKTRKEKYNAVLDEIEEKHKAGRPVLVGTVSVEVSETLSRMLRRRGISPNVLNAKYHQSEAEIITQAGHVGAVTIATNMAGRGTDIKLDAEVVKGRVCLIKSGSGVGDCQATKGAGECEAAMPCGLHIIGTERHESRRIDRQLRGRSGRQGDPGSSLFFLSLEDDLMRLFGSDRIAGMMDRLGVQEGEVITHPFVTKAIERAQKRVEGHNFEIRKHLLDYDNVMNQQREVIYALRNEALEDGDLSARMGELVENKVVALIEERADPKAHRDTWDLSGLADDMQTLLLGPVDLKPFAREGVWDDLREVCLTAAHQAYARREEAFGPERMREVERRIQIAVIDEKWRDHLYEIDQLRGGIGLRAYGQKDPLLEYKAEAYRMFEELVASVEEDTVRYMFRVMPAQPSQPAAGPRAVARPSASGGRAQQPSIVGGPSQREPAMRSARTMHGEASAFGGSAPPPPEEEEVAVTGGARAGGPGRATRGRGVPIRGGPAGGPAPAPAGRTVVRTQPKVGRNENCPCGSGLKYKKCCGANQ